MIWTSLRIKPMDIIRRIAVSVVCLLMAVGSLEAKRPFVRVNGFEVSKHVTSIEMEGNMMLLRWDDNTVMRGRLADVMINLACHDCVDKARILSVSGMQTSKMRVEGLTLGSTYSLYDLMGNCLGTRTVDSPILSVDISHLTTGIYLLKCQSLVMKFVKG